MNAAADKKADADANHDAPDRKQSSFAQNDIHDVKLGCTERLQNSDLASPFHYGGVHRLENHDDADSDGDSDHDANERRQHAVDGNRLGRE